MDYEGGNLEEFHQMTIEVVSKVLKYLTEDEKSILFIATGVSRNDVEVDYFSIAKNIARKQAEEVLGRVR